MPSTCFTTSWDDGHPNDLRVAEMLSRHKLRGTFYIPRHIETGVMSDAQIRELAAGGFEIGAHTINHVFLDTVDDETAAAEIGDSKKWVADVTGGTCTMFCPPGGKFLPRHAPAVRQAGYAGVRTVEFMSLDFPRQRRGYVEMPTTLQAFPHRPISYLKNIAKRCAMRNAWLYVTRGRGGWQDAAARLMEHVAQVGGVFHLWGHSWEIEQTAQWGRLDEVLAMMSRSSGENPCLTNGEICGNSAAVNAVERVQKSPAVA